MDSYDAIIIGLGPSGAAAAHDLARAGLKVLVLAGQGGRKPCGGCLSERWRFLFERLDPPDWLWEHPVRDCTIAAPGRDPVPWRTQTAGAYLVQRHEFDAWLARRAEQAGAKVLPHKAESLEQDAKGVRVRAAGETHGAGWLIGADGAAGFSARSLGFRSLAHCFAALVEERPLPDHLARQLNGGVLVELGGIEHGYAWLFARGARLNLGIGSWRSRTRSGRPGLQKAYAAFLRRYGLGKPGKFRGAAIPCPTHRTRLPLLGRIALVGDAGGLADPFLGEGIGQAMCSGVLAAQAVIKGDLSHYGRSLKSGLLKEHFHAWVLARLIYFKPLFSHKLLVRRPGALEFGFKVLRGQLTHRGLWGAVARKMLDLRSSLDQPPGSNYIKLLN